MSKLTVRLAPSEGGIQVLAPSIGRVRLLPTWPEALGAGAVIGRIQVLRQEHLLTLPDQGGPWVVEQVLVRGADVGVGATQPLLVIRNWDANAESTEAAGSDGVIFASPMSGQYYRRPSPEHPPFVSVGDEIEEGAQIGLVEVMKFFYPLVFSMKGRYRVTELVLGDSASIDAGDAVLRLEPI